MRTLCACQKVLLILGVREMDLNEQIWPKVRNITWPDLKTALDQLATKGLAIKSERTVESYRLAVFYKLTGKGQEEKSLLLSGEEENNGTGFIFEGSCCLNQAA